MNDMVGLEVTILRRAQRVRQQQHAGVFAGAVVVQAVEECFLKMMKAEELTKKEQRRRLQPEPIQLLQLVRFV